MQSGSSEVSESGVIVIETMVSSTRSGSIDVSTGDTLFKLLVLVSLRCIIFVLYSIFCRLAISRCSSHLHSESLYWFGH